MIPRNTERVTSLASVLAPLESFDQVFEHRIQTIYSERDKVGPRCEFRKKFWSRKEKELGGKGMSSPTSVCAHGETAGPPPILSCSVV